MALRKVFLICSERSGSNLMTQIMNSHSLCLGKSPNHLYRLFITIEAKYGDLLVDDNWKKLICDISKAQQLKIGEDWATTVTTKELLDNVELRSAVAVIDYIYEKEAKHFSKEILFIKEVKTYKLLPALLQHDASIKFINQVRDPRDMALSWSKSALHRGDIVRASKIWSEDQYYSFLLEQSLYKQEIIVQHTYEQLVSNTEEVLRKMCAFIDIPFESGMLDFQNVNKMDKVSASSDSWRNLNKAIMKDNFKKYAKKLSEEQIRFIEKTCYKEMNAFDYELDFPLFTEEEFIEVRNKLEKEERQEKEEYNKISETEKNKRITWMEMYKDLHPTKLF